MTAGTVVSTTLDAALHLVEERGWYVYPCEPGGKRPAYHPTEFPHGFLGATNDSARVLELWNLFGPATNLGVATQPSGLAVVDIDAQHGGLATLATLRAEHVFPPTLAERTPSGGWHLYYTAPPGEPLPSKGIAGLAGIEMRAGRSCITCSPSAVRDGRPYEWLDALAEVVPLPERIAILACPRPIVVRAAGAAVTCRDAYVRSALEREADAVRHDGGGSNDFQLNASAFSIGTLIGAGLLDAQEATAVLLDAAVANGRPERSALSTIRRALRAGAAKPRVIRPRRAS